MAALAEAYEVTTPTVLMAAYGRTRAHLPGALTETLRARRASHGGARTKGAGSSHEGQTTTRLSPSLLRQLEKRRATPTEGLAEVIDAVLRAVRRRREPRLVQGLLAVSTWPHRDPKPQRGRPFKRDMAPGRITWLTKRAARILDSERHAAAERRTDVLSRLLREI
jgi:hypothetical protein